MAQSDLFTAIGLPPMNAADLGVSPPPVAPTPAPASEPPGLQKPFALALLAGALAGGKATSGLVSGVMQGHQQKTVEHQRQQQIDQQEALRQQGIQAQQQQQYETTLNRRQQEYGAIINGPHGFYEAVAQATTPEQYDQQVQQYASLLQTRGFRVDANKLRAMAPFVVASDTQKASALVDKLLKDPLNQELMKASPERFLAGQILFQSNGDQTARKYPITQLLALAGRSVVMDDQGKPLIPEASEGKIGTAFQEALGSARLAFKAQYNREPTPKEQQALVERAIETTKEKPAGAPPRERFNMQPITNRDGTTSLVRINMDTGEASPVALPDGAAAGKGTDAQRLSAAYLERTEAADINIVPFETQLATLGAQADVQMPTLLQSDLGQRYSQARDEFINAALRRESGAAIQPSEYERYDRVYFVRPGDKPPVIRQKQAARRRVIEGFKTTAGNIVSGPQAAPTDEPSGADYVYDPVTKTLRKARGR